MQWLSFRPLTLESVQHRVLDYTTEENIHKAIKMCKYYADLTQVILFEIEWMPCFSMSPDRWVQRMPYIRQIC